MNDVATEVRITVPEQSRDVATAVKVDIRNLDFRYGKGHALKNVNLAVPANAVTSIIGPSGCGKSTLLRTINRIFELYPDHSVVTNLFNFTLPLIRYRMADILRPVESGAHAPYLVIESLVGRNELQPKFKTRDGGEDFISPHTINEIFVAGVTRFQMQLLGADAFRFMV